MGKTVGDFLLQVGVCPATSGPGANHLVNGLYEARLDRQPVVAIHDLCAVASDHPRKSIDARAN